MVGLGFSTCLVIAVSLGVGGHLLRRGCRQGARYEILMGLCLCFDGLEWLFWAVYAYAPVQIAWVSAASVVACRVMINASAICLLLFLRDVFRPGSALASCLVAALSATMILAIALTGILAGDWAGCQTQLLWARLELGAQCAANVWAVAESYILYRKMHRRVRLSIADPVVANSFGLWALYAGGSLAGEVIYFAAIKSSAVTGSYPYAFDAAIAACTIMAELAIWLAFTPPQFYRRWLRAAACPATPASA